MPDNDLQALKQHPRVLDLYRSRLSLKQDGRRWRGPCPFHADKHATNFDVFENQGTLIYKCLSCGVSGSILDLIQKTDGVDFKDAVKIVREFTSGFTQDRARVEQTFKPVGNEEKKTLQTFSMEEYARLEKALENSKEAISFLHSRGISLETAQRLRVGFRSDVGKLAGEDNSSVAGQGWLAFPTFSDGHVTSIKYRSVVRKAFTRQPNMKVSLFNLHTIDYLEPVFLVEGEVDALTLEGADFRAVSLPSATYGLAVDDKAKLLAADYVIIAGDNDPPGLAASEKHWKGLSERTFVLQWPAGIKDANQFWLEVCKQDKSVFRTKIDELVAVAKSRPMPNVYSLPESMRQSNWSSLSEHPDRIRFPWKGVDEMVNILPGGVLNVTATQTGMGKTALLMNILMYAAKNGKTVLNYSAELSPEEYSNIVAAHVLRKERTDITDADLKAAASAVAGYKFYIGRNPDARNSDDVLDLLDKAIPILGIEIAAIDHIHHICQGKENDVKDQNEAAVKIKNLATKHNIPIIVISQPRKADSGNKGKEIHITDIKGGGGIADAADAVMSIHRDFVKNVDPSNPPPEPYESLTKLRLLKGRSQGRGKAYCELMFLGIMATFVEPSYQAPPPGTLDFGS